MRRTIGIPFEGNGGNSDHRSFGKSLFQNVIVRFAFSQTEPPAIVMDDDANVIGIVEGCGTAIERRVIKVPPGRSKLPDEPGKVMSVLVVAGSTTIGSKVILIPPLQLRLWR